jgi:hypothetical protein
MPGEAAMFSGKRKALEQQVAELTEELERTGALGVLHLKQERADLEAQLKGLNDEIVRQRREAPEQLQTELEDIRARVSAARGELEGLRRDVVELSDAAALQEVGVYQFHHPLENAEAYKHALAQIGMEIKRFVKDKQAVEAASGFTFNNSEAKGRKVVSDLSKLMLRAYNSEADIAVRTLKNGNLKTAHDRLTKAAVSVEKLGAMMHIRISNRYHALRLRELELVADYQVKLAMEKEEARAERERLRDEERARREFAEAQKKLDKELAHYRNALSAVSDDDPAAAQLRDKVAELEAAREDVERRAANIRAGYVYVISNFGAFGERMVKIGMTRRLEPMERVYELGDASVPFRFDVHAIVFSDDAVALEQRLHQELADKRVNLVNMRREFFYATPQEVRDVLQEVAAETAMLSYAEEPEAPEWRQSEGERLKRHTPEVAGVA